MKSLTHRSSFMLVCSEGKRPLKMESVQKWRADIRCLSPELMTHRYVSTVQQEVQESNHEKYHFFLLLMLALEVSIKYSQCLNQIKGWCQVNYWACLWSTVHTNYTVELHYLTDTQVSQSSVLTLFLLLYSVDYHREMALLLGRILFTAAEQHVNIKSH